MLEMQKLYQSSATSNISLADNTATEENAKFFCFLLV